MPARSSWALLSSYCTIRPILVCARLNASKSSSSRRHLGSRGERKAHWTGAVGRRCLHRCPLPRLLLLLPIAERDFESVLVVGDMVSWNFQGHRGGTRDSRPIMCECDAMVSSSSLAFAPAENRAALSLRHAPPLLWESRPAFLPLDARDQHNLQKVHRYEPIDRTMLCAIAV